MKDGTFSVVAHWQRAALPIEVFLAPLLGTTPRQSSFLQRLFSDLSSCLNSLIPY